MARAEATTHAPGVTTLPSATSRRNEITAGWDMLRALELQVKQFGACSLPGVTIDFDTLVPKIERAMSLGFVSAEHGRFVIEGLWHGFDLGVDVSKLKGKQKFRNYPSALGARPFVSKAIRSRLDTFKTLCLGRFTGRDKNVMPDDWDSWRIFPLGAVPKPLEPDSMRPVSDHTRTGLKLATEMDFYRHSVNAYEEIAAYLKQGYCMRVGDVDGAFPLLPLAPRLWRYFLFHWWDVSASDDDASAAWCLYVHLCGDFGAAGLPGTWKVFFSDVIVGVARAEGVLTLPLVVYVDDTGNIGKDRKVVDREGIRFQHFLKELGIFMKELKVRAAATLQLMLGFWWDSLTQTRTLEERKFKAYVDMLTDFADRRVLTLRDMQQLAGRMQRAVMTLPPGAACFLANLFALMRGLVLPWQKRRVSRVTRRDFTAIKELLELNLGKGYYTFDQFGRAPAVYTDASRSRAYTGGGYISMCGRYRWWRYGMAAAKNLIDVLEGDAFLVAVEDLSAGWRKCVVPCYIDNRTFGRSATKGWSRAERLGMLLKKLFTLAITHECVYEIHWISSAQNKYADALSRPDNEAAFIRLVLQDGLFADPYIMRRHPASGGVRKFGPAYSSDDAGDGPTASSARLPTALTLTYTRASVFVGVPTQAVMDEIDEILDSRLAESSLQSISAALAHWDTLRVRYSWDRVLQSEDALRGGKLATWVAYMVNETELVSTSIGNYVWALRAWMKYQRQDDPILGVPEWDDFMQGVHVLAWVAAEPRRRVPLDLIKASLATVNTGVFWEVQAVVLMLILLFTFARSETPCPKSFNGAGALDETKHLLVEDVDVKRHRGKSYVAVRLKCIKQDGRMERPEAADNEDWIIIGNTNDEFGILNWIQRLFALHGAPRDRKAAFFMDKDRRRCLTYSNAMRDVRALWARVIGADAAARYGLHGLRVAGYNGAKRGKHGTTLAVAHGGWASAAHERYDRFDIDDVLDIPNVITAHTDVEQSSVACLQRAPLPVPASTATIRPSPRPAMRAGTGSGALKGSKRKRGAIARNPDYMSTRATAPSTSARALRKGARVDIYWTGDKAWCKATVQELGDDMVATVRYDAHDGYTCDADLTYVHDMHDVRWRFCT